MKRLLLLAAAALALAGPARAQSTAAQTAAPLVVATYAYAANDRVANLTPLAAELARAVNRPLRVLSYPTVPALLAAVRAGQVDVAFLNTLGFLQLSADERPAAVPLARLQAPAAAGEYRACLVARRSAGLGSAAELRARAGQLRLVLAGEHSTSGHLLPRLWLQTQGLADLEGQFAARHYAGSHAQVLAELQAGRAEVGACGLSEYQQLQARGAAADLQLLWVSDDIPLGPVVARAALDPAQRQALQQVLLRAPQQQPAAFRQLCQGWAEARAATQFVPVAPGEYEAFFRLLDSTDERVHGLPGQGEELRRLLAQYVR
jgi:phosphate/phosphite/phosphonate ABC transporter binding protein